MSEKRAEMRRKIDEWFAMHCDGMLEDLRQLIAINSVRGPAQEGAPFGPDSRAALALAGKMLEAKGFPASDFENVIVTADWGPAPPLMGILAHLDIVEAGEGWGTNPFTMTIKDGKIYGRGASDDKGPAVAAMYAMSCARELCPEPKHGLRLILGSAEETGFDDIALYLNKNEPPPNVFSPDAEFPLINTEKGRFAPFFGASWDKDTSLPRIVSIKGGKTMNIVPNRAEAVIEGLAIGEAETYCRNYSEKTGASISAASDNGRLIIVAEGTAAHASTPQLGLNAQTAIIEMLAAMPFAESKGFDYVRALNRLVPHGDFNGNALGIAMSDELSGKLTVNFGVLRYTEIDFAGVFDMRTAACADEIDLPGMVRTALEREGVNLTNSTISKCHHTPEDSPFVQTLLRVYEEYTGNPGKCLTSGGSTYVHDIPGGVAYGCAMPGISHNAHGANEFIGVEQLLLSAKIFTTAILDMCG